MKKTVSIIMFVITCHVINAQGINFEHGTFEEALTKAKEENKMVFMDCYTTWCGPCKMMSKDIFPQKEVGDYINANFVSIKMDMEKGEGINLTKYYDVKAFPTLLFMDANGKVLHTKVGGLYAAALIAEAKIASDPTKQFVYIEKQYLNGNRDLSVASAYIKGLHEAYKLDELKKIGNEIIPTLTEEQYNTEEGFIILAYTGVGFKSEVYNYVLKNRALFIENEKIGQESVDYLIGNAINKYMMDVAKNGTMDEFNKAIVKTKEDFVSPQQDMLENHWLNQFYLEKQEFDKWFDSNIKQAESQTDLKMKHGSIINTAYRISLDPMFESSKHIYKKAIDATEKVKAEDSEMIAAYYCLASLYKKVGNKENALINIKHLIEKEAAKEGEPDKRVTDLESEIENM